MFWTCVWYTAFQLLHVSHLISFHFPRAIYWTAACHIHLHGTYHSFPFQNSLPFNWLFYVIFMSSISALRPFARFYLCISMPYISQLQLLLYDALHGNAIVYGRQSTILHTFDCRNITCLLLSAYHPLKTCFTLILYQDCDHPLDANLWNLSNVF